MSRKKPKKVIPLDKQIKKNFLIFTIGAAFNILSCLSFLGKIIPLPTELTYLSAFSLVTMVLVLIASISLKKCDPIFKKAFIYAIIYIVVSVVSGILIFFDNDMMIAIGDSLNDSSELIFLLIVLFTIWNARQYLISKGSTKYIEKGYFIALLSIQLTTLVLNILLSAHFLVSNYFISITCIYLERILSLAFAIMVFVAFLRTLIYLKRIKKEEEVHE